MAQPQQPGSDQGQRSRFGNGGLEGLVDIAEPGGAEEDLGMVKLPVEVIRLT